MINVSVSISTFSYSVIFRMYICYEAAITVPTILNFLSSYLCKYSEWDTVIPSNECNPVSTHKVHCVHVEMSCHINSRLIPVDVHTNTHTPTIYPYTKSPSLLISVQITSAFYKQTTIYKFSVCICKVVIVFWLLL